jgi:tetratricopeptide (TPR) repeat protein
MNARAAGIALFLLLSSTISFAQMSSTQFGRRTPTSAPEMSTLTVTVKAADDSAATDARVEIHDMSGTVLASGYTNGNGILEVLGHFPSGAYEVVATHGLSEVRDRINLTSGGLGSIGLRLPAGADQADSSAGNNETVSVAQYKVPEKARKLYRKAREALEKSKFDEASNNLSKALEIYPNYADALCLRGVLKMDKQDKEGAVADFDQAIHIDPSYSMSYFAMGAVYNLMSKFDDALRTLQRGTTLAPNAWQGYFEMGKAYLGKADYMGAVKALDKAQSLTKEPYPLISLVKGHALLGLKQYPEAMAELEAFLQKAPGDPHTRDAQQMLSQAKAFAAQQ